MKGVRSTHLRLVVGLLVLGTLMPLQRSGASHGVTAPLFYPFLYPITGLVKDGVDAPRPGGREHDGYDIFGWDEHKGTTTALKDKGGFVYASWFGRVTRAESIGAPCDSYGKAVYIDHGNGYETRYAHLYSDQVSVGQRVAPGQRIGIEGRTGSACGQYPVHLHFEIRKNGVPVNLNTLIKPNAGLWVTSGAPIAFTNEWHLNGAADSSTDQSFNYGSTSERGVPVFGDWNCDGRQTPGIVRVNKMNGGFEWHLKNSLGSGAADVVVTWGRKGDIPIVGDWRKEIPTDRTCDGIGIFRNSREWHLNFNSGGLIPFDNVTDLTLASFGSTATGDHPVVGDWNCDNVDTPGITRVASSGALQWHLNDQWNDGVANYTPTYGNGGDRPLAGRWQMPSGVPGTCRDTPAITRVNPANNGFEWHLSNSLSGGGAAHAFSWATANDFSLAGAWDSADVYKEFAIAR